MELRDASTANPPRQREIRYRTSTHHEVLAWLLDALGDPDRRGLATLTTRECDDLTIGLLDAFATMADVLGFYQERIANEHYLGTATERLSVRALAELVNFQLAPGKSADAWLAFDVEADVEQIGGVPLHTGIKVDSMPGPDEQLQKFETVEEFTAYPAWNEIRPRQSRVVPLAQLRATGSLLLDGLGLNISIGDRLMFEHDNDRFLEPVLAVTEDRAAGTTTVDFPPLAPDPAPLPAWKVAFATAIAATSAQISLGPQVFNSSWIASQVQGTVWKQSDLLSQGKLLGQSANQFAQAIQAAPIAVVPDKTAIPDGDRVSVFRVAAAVFGHNAPVALPSNAFDRLVATEELTSAQARAVNDEIVVNQSFPAPGAASPSHIDDELISRDGRSFLPLASEHKSVAAGSVIAVETIGESEALFFGVDANESGTVSKYQLSSRVSQLAIVPGDDIASLDGRRTRESTVYGEPESLVVAQVPVTEDVAGNIIVLDGVFLDLQIGQTVSITGAPSNLVGVTRTELRAIADLHVTSGATTLTLDTSLSNSFTRESVTIRANLVRATHGESVVRVLGSGDASLANQTFLLPETPLTYLAAETPTGIAAALEIQINGVRWHERPTLSAAAPEDRAYMVRHREDGGVEVIFGDGDRGSRIPTGVENVVANYRVGSGSGGLVRPGQLSLLSIKPHGVKAVINPEASFDASDGTGIDDARRAAPMQSITLGRVVSLRDHEDFARAFAGVAKALASWVWVDEQREVVVSIAGVEGDELAEGADKLVRLSDALLAASDRSAKAHVISSRVATFVVSARLSIDSDFDTDTVLTDAEQRLRGAYSFSSRGIGEPVFRSEVVAVLHTTPGVIAVDLDLLDRSDTSTPLNNSRLLAALPRRGERVDGSAGALVGAELLLVDPRPLDLKEAAP